MTTPARATIGKPAQRFLADLVSSIDASSPVVRGTRKAGSDPIVVELLAADLIVRGLGGTLDVTSAGRAYLARMQISRSGGEIDPFLGQHLDLAQREIAGPNGRVRVTMDDAESPLAWLARRKGRDGRFLIEPEQLLAGERLRAEFTRAQLMPRITSNWQAAVAQGARSAGGGPAASMTDVIISARQSVRRALAAAGPEFAGLLVDICCFLKGLEDTERERMWPPRSAKVVLQLGLDRLVRHYGFAVQARGHKSAEVRTWRALDTSFSAGNE